MHIQFLGAARTVTGSCYLIHVNNQSLLLECGLYQGKREESYEKNRNFNFFFTRQNRRSHPFPRPHRSFRQPPQPGQTGL